MKAFKSGTEIRIEDGYLHKESIKEILGRRYEAESKAWFVPLCMGNAALIQTLGAELDSDLKTLVSMTKSDAVADEEPIARMPIKVQPYKHQVRAFNFALRLFGGDG